MKRIVFLAFMLIAFTACTNSEEIAPSKTFQGTIVSFAAAGRVFDGASFVLLDDGNLWGWGSNNNSRISPHDDVHLAPVMILDDVSSFSVMSDHVAAIRTDGSLWTWGSNSSGQLGDGTITAQVEPQRIMEGVAYVAAGISHTMAITNDGVLWGWGSNEYGQIGVGHTGAQIVPARVLDDVISVSVGTVSSAAIRRDGSLWTWGVITVVSLAMAPQTEVFIPSRLWKMWLRFLLEAITPWLSQMTACCGVGA